MAVVHSFKQMVAEATCGGQPIYDAIYGRTYNAFSEEEIQRRVALCDERIAEAKQEAKEIQFELLKAHSQYRFPQYLVERGRDDAFRKLELKDRIDALEKRKIQIQKTDPDGRFGRVCFDIETKLNEFRTRLASDFSDKPTPPYTSLHQSPMLSGMEVFN